MTLPVFWRLMLSHIGILMLSGAVCLYSIVQLGSLSGSARGALDTNYRMIAYQEALVDAFLSQVRYGGKYLITHTEARHEQLRQFKDDFARYFGLLTQLDQAGSIAAPLSRIGRLHAQYHELFDREAAYIRARQGYAQTRYHQERDRIVENTLSELEALRTLTRAKLQEKLQSIDQGARTARKLATVTTLVVLLLGALLSLKVARSIDSSSADPAVPPLLDAGGSPPIAPASAAVFGPMQEKIKLRLIELGAFAVSRIGTWNRRSGS